MLEDAPLSLLVRATSPATAGLNRDRVERPGPIVPGPGLARLGAIMITEQGP